MAYGGARGAQDAFKFQAGDHIWYAAIAIIAPGFWVKHLVSGSQDDGPGLDFKPLRFLIEIDRVMFADTLADRTFFILQIKAGFRVYIGNQRNRLGKIDMDGFVQRKILIIGIRDFYRTVLYTGTTTRAVVLDNVSGLFNQGDLEVSCFPFYTINFSIGQDLDIGMPADLDQFGREYSHGAVIGGKGLVQLGHLAADGR